MPKEMHKTIEDAVEYASSSNSLEENGLTEQEIEIIVEDIQEGKTDEAVIEEVVSLVKTLKPGENRNQGVSVYGRSR